MFMVKMFTSNNGEIETIEKLFADFVTAAKFFNDVHDYLTRVNHAKLIAHHRVVDEY